MTRIVRLVIIGGCIFLTACATVPREGMHTASIATGYIDIEEFCKKYNLKHNFDTIDDSITLSSATKEVRLLLHAPTVYYGGSFFSLRNSPYYSNGKIYIPRELETIISSKESASFKPSFDVKTILIDPGHGGHDPGAISMSGIEEKNLNLSVSQYLKEALEEQGFRVILSRTRDEYFTLKERVELAKRHNADLFVSIHANSNRSRHLNGVEVYYLSPSRLNSEARAANLAKEVGFSGNNMPRDASTILWDLSLTKNYTLSIEFSRSIYDAFKKLGFKVRLPKKAPFYVLRQAYVPSVLVEIGYLSNKYEEKILRRDSYQKQTAEAITLGIASLKKQYSAANNKVASSK